MNPPDEKRQALLRLIPQVNELLDAAGAEPEAVDVPRLVLARAARSVLEDFRQAILSGEPIQVFNYGEMKRDFTYVSDIVAGITHVIDHPPVASGKDSTDLSESKTAPYKVYNIGNSSPVRLMDFINAIETKLGIIAKKELLPMQPGDVPMTWADTSDLERDLGYRPDTPIKVGVGKFIDWYREYYWIGGGRKAVKSEQ